MNTPDETARVVWDRTHALCDELLDLDARAVREGWGPLGARIADAACEALAHAAAACGGHSAFGANRLATLSALRESAEALVRVQKFVQTADRCGHFKPVEGQELADQVKETSGMMLALAVMVRTQGASRMHLYESTDGTSLLRTA